MKATKDVDTEVHIHTATELGRGRVASLTLSRLYLGESPRYSFYRRLSGSQDQFGQKQWRKSPPLRYPESNPGRPASSQVPCSLMYLTRPETKEDNYKREILLSYGVEIWKLNKNLISKLMSMEMDFLRRSARHSRFEKIRNNVIRKEMNVQNSVIDYVT